MKITDVAKAPVYGIQAAYAVKSEIAKDTADARTPVNTQAKEAKEAKEAKGKIDTTDEPKKKVSAEKVDPQKSKDSTSDTKVQFSIERELHLVVTHVLDASTNKVIRQMPAEETIKMLKLKYQQSKKETLPSDVVV